MEAGSLGPISLIPMQSWNCSQGDFVQHEGHLTQNRKFQQLTSNEPPATCITQRVQLTTLNLRRQEQNEGDVFLLFLVVLILFLMSHSGSEKGRNDLMKHKYFLQQRIKAHQFVCMHMCLCVCISSCLTEAIYNYGDRVSYWEGRKPRDGGMIDFISVSKDQKLFILQK